MAARDHTPTPKRRPRPTGSRRAGSRTQRSEALGRATPAGPRSRRGSVARQEILAAARTAFARMGYGGTRIEDIAAAAGATRTAVYHYFPSKRDVFIAVGREATVAFRQVLETARAVPTQWTTDDLRRMIDAHLAFLDVHGVVISTWTQATWDDPELRDIGLGVQLHYFAAFGKELARLRGDASVDPIHESIAFQGMIERLWFFSRSGGAGVIHDDELRHTLLLEAEAILTRRTSPRRRRP